MADEDFEVSEEPLSKAATQLDSDLEAKVGVPEAGARLGHYRVLQHLGTGAMGTVVEAHDETLDRRVAIKLLHERTGGKQEKRLLREAQALARLSHPNVVQVYEVGEAGGHVFIAMELVSGQTLETWQEEPRPWREVVDVYLQAGRGLAAAHGEGLIHRDFKPGNAIIDRRGRVRVLDFGLARESAAIEEIDVQRNVSDATAMLLADSRDSSGALSENLTRTGAVLGTPAYMAPEQLGGKGGSALSDQFNFCVAFYEALYRARPFPHESIGELVSAVLGGNIEPPPSGVRAPRALWPIIRRGLSRRPKDRFSAMEPLLEQLEQVTRGGGAMRWIAFVGVGVAVGAGVWIGRADTTTPCQGARALLDDRWDERRAGALGDALRNTGVLYADATNERVTALLDGYADAWVVAHTDACEATSVHRRQSSQVLDLRMRCLDDRRRALGRTVELLVSTDAAMVEHAVAIASGLPPIDHCDDVTALRADLPPPEDAEVAAEVDGLREQLELSRGLCRADRAAEGLTESNAVLERAIALDYAPLVVEARLERGTSLELLGRYPEAIEELTRGFSMAVELDYERPATITATALCSVTGRHLAKYEVGRTWGVTAEALARRVEPGGELHASALRTAAIVEASDGNVEGAAERFEHALRILEEHPEPRGLSLARSLGDTGNLRAMQGRFDEALVLYGRAQGLRLAELGPGHPDLGVGAVNNGRVYQTQGKLEASAAEYRSALTLWERTRASDHPSVATVLNNLAVVLDQQGRPEEALGLYRRVLEARIKSLGAEHPFVGQTMVNIALSERALGNLEEARELCEEALKLFELKGGRDVEHGLSELGETELMMGKITEARRHLERSRRLTDERTKGDVLELMGVDMQLARVRWAEGAHEEARARILALRALCVGSKRCNPNLAKAADEWLADPPPD